jgi:hypothetical protein
MGWVADDFAAWLVELLADAVRRRLTEFFLGTEFERELRSAGTAAVQATAAELSPGNGERAAHLARVISEVFAVPALHPAAAATTVLEAMQNGIAAQVAVLEDPGRTTVPGLSSAAAEGIADGMIAAALTRRLLTQIMSRAGRPAQRRPGVPAGHTDAGHAQRATSAGDGNAEPGRRRDPSSERTQQPLGGAGRRFF